MKLYAHNPFSMLSDSFAPSSFKSSSVKESYIYGPTKTKEAFKHSCIVIHYAGYSIVTTQNESLLEFLKSKPNGFRNI